MFPPMGLLVSYLLSRMGSRMFLEIAFIFLAPTIKRAVTSIVRKETIWDGQHRLTILQSGTSHGIIYEPSRDSEFFGHAFYEAASIRKINGRSYFIYSSENSNELCYATSQNYNGPYHFGGTIISNGDVGYHGRSGENRTNQTANDHGSLACIKGQWYIFTTDRRTVVLSADRHAQNR